MSRTKIINDPVHGFIQVPGGILQDLINHPYMQRLSRIRQISLGHYVYPGAHHTRFHHALGALHLMQEALSILRIKGIPITAAEYTDACIAILLHDIGHGPFSHTLENILIGVSHETLSLAFMEELDRQYGGQLGGAIAIFRQACPRRFLTQLVSGQLDMDRLDYLSRDSFFTGVTEGVVGYSRIIKMLQVADGNLVVEEKGIYSLEKFLIARRLMYWQVYLHKTVLAAEKMLQKIMERARLLLREERLLAVAPALGYFMMHEISSSQVREDASGLLRRFAALDDVDILMAVKTWQHEPDNILAILCRNLMERRLFQLTFSDSPPSRQLVAAACERIGNLYGEEAIPYFVLEGKESNHAYSEATGEIRILRKDGQVRSLTASMDYPLPTKDIEKYYLCTLRT